MSAPSEPLHDLVRSQPEPASQRAPASPRVTPEPAPSDTVLLALGATAGMIATLASLAMWRWWRNRSR